MSYVFGELSRTLMSPVFVDCAAGLALAAPSLEGGLVLHLRTLSDNVLRANAQRRGLGRARPVDPPQRIEHLSGGRHHPRGAHHPQGATARPPSNLHVQVLPGDLMSLLKLHAITSPVAWPSHTTVPNIPPAFVRWSNNMNHIVIMIQPYHKNIDAALIILLILFLLDSARNALQHGISLENACTLTGRIKEA
jgi:hypothetical protein